MAERMYVGTVIATAEGFRPVVWVTGVKADQGDALAAGVAKAAQWLRMRCLFATVDQDTADMMRCAERLADAGPWPSVRGAYFTDGDGVEWNVIIEAQPAEDELRP